MDSALDLEKALSQALERHLNSSGEAQTPPNLAEAIRYSLLAPGKRIRPRLGLACARMTGLCPEAALPAALSVEMIHCFTLIHDDLPCMDDDDYRRGRPSNHKVHGEALALLAGDALMMLALDTFADALPHVSSENFSRALQRFAWASGPRGVIGGQAAENLLSAQSSLEQLEHMHALKTGALFSAALLLPMDLAGILPQDPRGQAIIRFAAELGAAFQVADDLEDQDQDSTGDRTSILSHLSAQEARTRTLQKLKATVENLRGVWGDSAGELVAVADEVATSLQRNGPI
jgi:geranylgeranyl diphosphate synthase, type II